MTFLILKIWFLLGIAALIGLAAGWLFWGRSQTAVPPQPEEPAQDHPTDDLTQLKGVGPKLAEQCNAAGIYHFHQIAAWNEADLAQADEVFGNRPSRDDWVGQAQALIQSR